MFDDLPAQYAAYLLRFEKVIGGLAFGEFTKHEGRLIQKLAFDAFAPLYTHYMAMATHYLEGVDRGDTINDLAVKLIRDNAAQLILTSPV